MKSEKNLPNSFSVVYLNGKKPVPGNRKALYNNGLDELGKLANG